MYSKSSVTRFDHFVAWLLALGLYRLARGAMFVLLLAGAGCLHSHKAALARVPLVPAGERPLAQRLAGADLVVTATLAKTDRGLAAPTGGGLSSAGVRAAARYDVGVLRLRHGVRG